MTDAKRWLDVDVVALVSAQILVDARPADPTDVAGARGPMGPREGPAAARLRQFGAPRRHLPPAQF